MRYSLQALLLACSVVVSSVAYAGTPVVAPSYRVNLFLRSVSDSIPASSYTTGVQDVYGNVEILKSDAPGYQTASLGTVQQRLQATLDMTSNSTKTLSSLFFAGANHQRISSNGNLLGQCPAFAQAMSGAKATSSWKRGTALNTIFPNGNLTPGTVIAHFGGYTNYASNEDSPHVAVFLSKAFDTNGNFIGLNVVDQNGMLDVVINGVRTHVVTDLNSAKTLTAGTIAKHLLPWNSSSANPVLSAKNYHVVEQGITFT